MRNFEIQFGMKRTQHLYSGNSQSIVQELGAQNVLNLLLETQWQVIIFLSFFIICTKLRPFIFFRRFVRNQIIFANTMFKAVCYRPDESQIITAGTDRKVRV